MSRIIFPSLAKMLLVFLALLPGAIEQAKPSPVDAVKAYLESYRAGDEASIKSMQINDPAWELTSAGIKNAPARIALWKAIVERFGQDESKEPLIMETEGRRFELPPFPDVAELDSLHPAVSGDKAVIEVGTLKFKLKRIDGIWKVDKTQRPPTAKVARLVLDNQRRFRDIAADFTKDLQDGKFKSAAEMRKELSRRFAKAQPLDSN